MVLLERCRRPRVARRTTLDVGAGEPAGVCAEAPNPPVAILTDSLTASSGEAIVVAFRGLEQARSLGGATAGVPTPNVSYFLVDGAVLNVMTALDADRNKTWYSERIPADEPIFVSTYPAMDDGVVTAATQWLGTRGTCPLR
jgi:carboxyl-terminal processing protease